MNAITDFGSSLFSYPATSGSVDVHVDDKGLPCEYCYFLRLQDAPQLIGAFWKTGLSQASIKLLENVLAEFLCSKTIPELLQDRF